MLRRLAPIALLCLATGCTVNVTQPAAPVPAPERPQVTTVVGAPATRTVTSAAGAAPTAADAGYRIYRNARFGFSIAVPTGFVAGEEAADGDGLSWTGGGARLTAYGANNALGATAAERLTDCKSTLTRVTYTFLKDNTYTCSGYRPDGQVGYQWGIIGAGNEHSVKSFQPGPL